MFFLLARDSDGSLRLLSPATFGTRREALDELALLARSSATFSEPDEVFVGDIDAVSPVLLVRVGEMQAEQPAGLPPIAEAYAVEAAYAEAVMADVESETVTADEPAETVEEALIESALFAPSNEPEPEAEAPAAEAEAGPTLEPAGEEGMPSEAPLVTEVVAPESTEWPWMAGLAETADMAEAADHETAPEPPVLEDEPTPEPPVLEYEPAEEPPVVEDETGEPTDVSGIVPLESEVEAVTPEPVALESEVEAYEPPTYEEPSVDAVDFVPPAEDVYVPRPVIMGDYADEQAPVGWDEIREPKGVTEAENELVDPFAAVEAPATADEDLPGMPGLDLEEAVEELPVTTLEEPAPADDTAAAVSDEQVVVTDPEETPDLGLPMWQPETPPVPPAEIPVGGSTEGWPEVETFEAPAEPPATEPEPVVPADEPSQPAAFVEVPEEASAAFPGLEAFLASRGVTPDIKSVPTGMPQADESAVSPMPSSAGEDTVGYELGGSDLGSSTCDDCVYVNTCPKAHQSTPADCGSFQWKAV